MNNKSQIVSERFWSRVSVTKLRKCWNWNGAKDKNGYGQFRMNGRTIRATRVAFWLRNGIWPINACHSCDNPACCNPDHLFSGTHIDNMRDMSEKGRSKTDRGEEHAGAVLTDSKVIAIRTEYKNGKISMSALAAKHACSFSTIHRVISRSTWRHLP